MQNNNILFNMLMNKLKQQNPAGYSQIQQWMSSGQNPQQILNQMLQSGQITQNDITRAQGTLNQMQNSNTQKRF